MSGKLNVIVKYSQTGEVINVTPRTMNATITEKIDAISTFSIGLQNLTHTHAFDDIDVRYDNKTIFKGVVEAQSDRIRGGRRFTSWKGRDYTVKLENRVVNKIYTNMTVEAIISDLLASYPCGVTGNNVKPTLRVVEQIRFPFISLLECIKQLADIVGWRWFIDANNDLHFFEKHEGTASLVFSTTTNGGLRRNILNDTIEMGAEMGDKMANRVWVIGAKTAAKETRTQTFQTPGERIFKLGFTPRNYKVYKNGVKIADDKVRLDTPQNEANSSTEILVNLANQVIRIPDSKPALGTNDTLRIEYNPEIQIIDYFEDPSSVRKFGLYEKAIKDRQIIEKMAARSRGRAELKRRNTALRTIQFDTTEMNVQRGKRYHIVVPELYVDSYWLCTGVITTIQAPDKVNVSKTVEFEEVS